jgi:hypothetical protein
MHIRPITSSLVSLSLLVACEGTTEPAAPPSPGLSAAAAGLSAAAAGLTRHNISFELELSFDCTAAGGEIIDVSGRVRETLTIVTKDELLHFTFAIAGQGLTGTGRSTGTTYHVTGMGMNTFTEQVRPGGNTFEFTFLDLTHLVAGDGTLWGAKFIQHITVTSTGQVVENEFDAGDCVQL